MCPSQGRLELFSQLPSSDRSCQCNWFLHRRNRDGNSTPRLGAGVFTQPGSDSDLSAFTDQVCFAPESGNRETQSPSPFCAKSGGGTASINHLGGAGKQGR